MEAHWQHLVPLHQAVEVQVVRATVPAVEVVGDMEAGLRPTAVQATLGVVLPEDMDHTVVVVGGLHHLDAEVDIQVHLELLHKVVEGDIPMAPCRHRTASHPPVAPATAKDMIPRPGPRID